MTTGLTVTPWPFPTRGLFLELDSRHIPADALASCNNMYYLNPYLLRSRGGIDSTYTTAASAVGPMYYWSRDSKLYQGNATTGLYKNGTVVAGPAQKVTSMCSFGVDATPTLIVAENETANPSLHTYDGTTYAVLAGTDIPRGRLVMSRGGRLWTTKSAEYPSRVWCSRVSDETIWTATWDDAAWWDLGPGSDGDIVDWVDYRGVLYIFKERAIWRLAGDTPVSIIRQRVCSIDKMVGGTVADCGRGVLYATESGVYPLGVEGPTLQDAVSRNIEKTLQPLLSASKAAFSPELGAYVVTTGTTAVYVANLNNRPDVWTKFIAPVAMNAVYTGNGLWFGGTNGTAYKYDHDDWEDGASTQFAVSLKTGDWNLQNELGRKNVRYVQGLFNGGENATVVASMYSDSSTKRIDLREVLPDGDNVFACNFNCKRVALQIEYKDRTGLPYFGGLALHWKPEGDIL